MRKNAPLFLFIGALVLLTLSHLLGYSGHFGFDDMHYAKLAKELKEGHFDPNDHFSYRLVLLTFTAISYSLLGINDLASSLPSMLFSACCLWVVYLLLRKQSSTSVAIGLALTLGSEWYLFYSDKLMPDIAVTMGACFAYLAVYRQYFLQTTNTTKNGLLLALALFLGFNSKGTILLLLPWLLFIFINDLRLKRNQNFWISTAGSGILLLMLYFGSMWYLFDDAFIRFKALETNSYLNRCSYGSQSLKILVERLTSGFWGMSYREGLLFPFLLLAPYFVPFRRNWLNLKKPLQFFSLSAIILLLSACFMSISLKAYNPMCLDIRHYLFVFPMVAAAAALYLGRLLNQSEASRWYHFLIYGGSLVLAIYIEGRSFWWVYLGSFSILLIYLILPTKALLKVSNLLKVLFIISLLALSAKQIVKQQKSNYPALRSMIYEQLINKKEAKYVITNPVQARIGNYYTGFNAQNTQFLAYNDFKPDTLQPEKEKYILTTWYGRSLSFLTESELPFYVQTLTDEKAIFRSENPQMTIYPIERLLLDPSESDTLFYSLQNFENRVEGWQLNEADLKSLETTKQTVNKVYEYSATLKIPIDTLQLESYATYLLEFKLDLYFEEPTEALIVASFENEESTVKWIGLGVNKQLKSYSNWWPVNHQVVVKRSEIEKAETLKLFLWNKDKKHCEIDNFELLISGIK